MSDPFLFPDTGRRRLGFLERLALGLVQALGYALEADQGSTQQGFLQQLDPRIKLVCVITLIICGVLARSLSIVFSLFLVAIILAFISNVISASLFKQVWMSVLLFTGTIALPSIVVVPGTPLLHIPLVDWTVTLQGLRSAAFLVGRAETSASFALLLILTTPWTHVLKAMRSLGVPVVVVAILGMTHRYVFVLLLSAKQMIEARRSRVMAPMNEVKQRHMVVSAAGVLLGKTFQLSSEVHLAMVSRGYRGEVRLLDEFEARAPDWIVLILTLSIPVLILWVQR